MAEPEPKPTLLTLPLKIREKSWKYACDDSVLTVMRINPKCDCKWYRRSCPCTSRARNNRIKILLLCRQIYAEALEPFVRSTQTRCNSNITPRCILSKATSRRRENVTDLRLHRQNLESLIDLLFWLPNLKVLRLFEPLSPTFGQLPQDISSLREMSGAKTLRIVTQLSDLMELKQKYPNIVLSWSRVMHFYYPWDENDKHPIPSYLSLFQRSGYYK